MERNKITNIFAEPLTIHYQTQQAYTKTKACQRAAIFQPSNELNKSICIKLKGINFI